MPLSDKNSHLSSDEHTNRNKQSRIWCEDCGKFVSDKTRHFQSETHLLKSQQENYQLNQLGQEVEIIWKEKTYIKLKLNPSGNLEEQVNEILSMNIFPRYKYQLSYLAKFSKFVEGKEQTFHRWLKSDLVYNHEDKDVHQLLIG